MWHAELRGQAVFRPDQSTYTARAIMATGACPPGLQSKRLADGLLRGNADHARITALGRRPMAKWLLLLAVVALIAASPAPQTFDARTVGGPASDAAAELYPAQGPGPFPAMVLLHPCNGVGPHSRT